jgi:hypothetical protein
MYLNQDACLKVLNQVFELEKKVTARQDASVFQRNIQRIKDSFQESGYIYSNPLGEPYKETRTDCEASISGNNTDKLVITEVIKPIIWYKEGTINTLIQKGVVIVASP